MDTIQEFAMGQANRDKELKVFDWDKAAELIKKKQPKIASAGLHSDWEWTGGKIFRDGKPIPREDTYVFLASTWAIPEIALDADVQECYKMESQTPGWDAETYWPDSAIAILEG